MQYFLHARRSENTVDVGTVGTGDTPVWLLQTPRRYGRVGVHTNNVMKLILHPKCLNFEKSKVEFEKSLNKANLINTPTA